MTQAKQPTRLKRIIRSRWWEKVPWQRADVNPVISSGLEDSLSGRVHALSNPG